MSTSKVLLVALMMIASPAMAQEEVPPPPVEETLPPVEEPTPSPPPSTEPVECALLDSANAILERNRFTGVCPSDPVGKGWRWVPIVQEPSPEVNPDTEVLDPPILTVEPDKVTVTRPKRTKTAEEIEVDKEQKMGEFGNFLLKRLCNQESRLRVLEGKPAITQAQCRQAIKDALN